MLDKPTSLLEVFGRLSHAYGPQDGWWPSDSAFEVAVGAVLTQATSWSNAVKAIGALKSRALLSADDIRRMEATDLAELIRPAGFHKRKAQTLKSVSNFMAEFGDEMSGAEFESTCSLRRRLLEIHGVGEETADAILLYALHRPTFMADAYARRLFTRLGVTPESWGYEKCRLFSMKQLPLDPKLYAEFHALIVSHGAATCRATPNCSECPLLDLCPTGQGAASGSHLARRPLR